ncbi:MULTISPECIES: stage 0 sporulation family protein [Myroides]|uniref:PSP1 C-terminal domain-containing protein n=1 Tax=Myroides albus TaxID=2562892 RepID=A0A6I3LKR2_9FLAO|nr:MULTISPECIES: regulatory iron-sulfur-containing complex subunit RicT [Myroides]MTG96605.1 hypothetical protein [Myroides albus]MVX34601.1 hypothetical protein [Myroides sp. LoEW2-1]UVD80982.1 hypothetical protein NWE55_06975 [Myroides albus]
MACTNCSTDKGSNGQPRGCQNNGTCGTDSCNKLAVFDWLSNMVYPSGSEVFDIVEVRFKNGRKDFYRYPKELTISMGDIVATETSPGHDIGVVSLTGELVKVQMKKKGADPEGDVLKIYRKATQKDIDIWQEVREKEEPVRMRARELAIELNLEMKISDVEFQGDGSKATFYYTASERVDFRQLIKDFAREFSIRIEMKQVGFRQEAARLGGVGSCGRELCCSTWLTDFRSVNTAAARYQQLSLNPQKLAGQCGKLKCCLNFELDTYLEALKDMPESDTKLMTTKGIAFCQKIDIFKGQMWFAYANNSANWYVLSTEQVKEIVDLNNRDIKGDELESYALEREDLPEQNAVEEDSVTRFDQPKRKKKPARKRKEKSNDGATAKEANATADNSGNRTERRPRNQKVRKEGEVKNVKNEGGENVARTEKKEGQPRVKNNKPKGPRTSEDKKPNLGKEKSQDTTRSEKASDQKKGPAKQNDAGEGNVKKANPRNKNRNNNNRKPKNSNNQNNSSNATE